ncbi:MAG: hypothetical protein LHW44_05480 [Candidatus Cloacimonetes bacterium]|nr:hypothetical protein [Candidatus Cloacimonadota bacterium]NLK50418.1 hypothetical protein [Candidatus Cloacimonadota bacterium]
MANNHCDKGIADYGECSDGLHGCEAMILWILIFGKQGLSSELEDEEGCVWAFAAIPDYFTDGQDIAIQYS